MSRAARAIVVALGLIAATFQLTPASAQSESPGTEPRAPRADWTFMVYNVADTSNIEEDLIIDIEHLAEVGSTDNVNIVALVDRAPGQYDGPMVDIPDFESTKLVRVDRGHVEELADHGEVDMASPQTLTWFVYTMMKEYPADHYALTIDDHGGSFSGVGWDDSTPPDADGRDANLRIPEVSSALAEAIDAAGEDKIDVLNYAACLLAEYDAASSLYGLVDYLLASEETTIGLQADMATMVQSLNDAPDDLFAAVDLFFEETTDLYLDIPYLTMSLIDIGRMPMVDAALESFAEAVIADIDIAAGPLARAQSQTIHYGVDGEDDSFQSYDIGDLMVNLPSISPEIDTARNALYQAVTASMVRETHGPAAAASTGMTIYFPVTIDDYIKDFYVTVAESPAWLRMLDAYYAADPSVPVGGDVIGGDGGELAFVGDADLSIDADGAVILADLDPSSAASAVRANAAWGAELNDGTIAYLLHNPATLDAGVVGTVAAGWSLTYLELTDSDAQVSLLATTLLTPVAGGVQASVPMIYQAANGAQSRGAIAFVFLDDGSTTPVQFTVTDDNGATATVTPDAGDIVAPLVLTESVGGDVGYELISDQAVDAVSLVLVPSVLASGSTLVAKLIVESAAGDVAVASGAIQIP